MDRLSMNQDDTIRLASIRHRTPLLSTSSGTVFELTPKKVDIPIPPPLPILSKKDDDVVAATPQKIPPPPSLPPPIQWERSNEHQWESKGAAKEVSIPKVTVTFNTPPPVEREHGIYSDKNVFKSPSISSLNSSPPMTLKTFKASKFSPSSSSLDNKCLEFDPLGYENEDGWHRHSDFLITCIALGLGLSNIWSLPAKAHAHDGFVIIWILSMFIVGLPLLFLELSLAYFSNKGAVRIWTAVPIFKGVGVCQLFTSLMYTWYFPGVASFALFYLTNGWSDSTWKTCQDNSTSFCQCYSESTCNNSVWLSLGEACFLRTVSEWDPTDLFTYNYYLIPGAVLVFFMAIVSITYGTCWIMRVILLSSLTTLALILTCLIYGLTTFGAEGLKAPFIMSFEDLKDITMWIEAIVQVLMSLHLSCGVIVGMASRTKRFGKFVVRDSLLIFFSNLIMGLLSVLAIGIWKENVTFRSRMIFDSSFIFAFFYEVSETFNQYQVIVLSIFAAMVLTSAINSMIPISFALATAIKDYDDREWLAPVMLFVISTPGSLLILSSLGLPGIIAIESYAVQGLLVFSALVFVIGFIFVYGGPTRLKTDFVFWTDKRITIIKAFINVLYTVVPAILTGCLILFFVDKFLESSPECNDKFWVMVLGWTLFGVGILIVLIFLFREILLQIDYGILNKVKSSIRSDRDWGPKDPILQHRWHNFVRYGSSGDVAFNDDSGVVNFTYADEKSTKF